MKIEIKKTKDKNIIQITTLDERWYHILEKDRFVPSSTWIADYYPKGIQFFKWLADKGWDEAEAIKQAAGDKGSRVHHAIEQLLLGNEVAMDNLFPDSDGEQGEITVEEWEAVMSFYDWWKETNPRLITLEQVVYNEQEDYAGTLDLICEIDGEIWIVDFKTSQYIWPSHELQVSSYFHADNIKATRMGILQVGYRKNKKGYKFTEIQDKFPLFLAAKLIWAEENAGKQPKQKDYPRTLTLKEEEA